MDKQILKQTAESMVASGKGILAADESTPTCTKRFDALGVECTEDSRQDYRGILVATPETEEYLSGIILFEETLYQKTKDGRTFIEVLNEKGILPGIKVDKGAKELALHEGEKVTEGLDGLRERLKQYYQDGARFAKWRAVIRITEDGFPSEACMHANAHALARYAGLCQEANIVPIVEPEVLINGNHSIEKCYEVTKKTLEILYKEMKGQDLYLEGTVLKASMVIAGTEASQQSTPQEVADMTVKCLKETVPSEVPGVVFLSGGQTDLQATVHLNLMNKTNKDLPWKLSFSYGRALQQPTIKLWASDPQGNRESAEKVLLHRCKMNGLATKGEYDEGMEG